MIFEKEDEDVWLNHDSEADQLLTLLKPFHDVEMEEWEVGTDAETLKTIMKN